MYRYCSIWPLPYHTRPSFLPVPTHSTHTHAPSSAVQLIPSHNAKVLLRSAGLGLQLTVGVDDGGDCAQWERVKAAAGTGEGEIGQPLRAVEWSRTWVWPVGCSQCVCAVP